MRNNTRTNSFIKWVIVAGDFIILNILLFVLLYTQYGIFRGSYDEKRLFVLVCNMAMVVSEYHFSTIIHERLVDVGNIIKRTTGLVLLQMLVSYIILRAMRFDARVGVHLLNMGLLMLVILFVLRFLERWLIKRARSKGFNTRAITMVGSHENLGKLFDKLMLNPTLGYKVISYYGSMDYMPRKGDLDDFVRLIDSPDQLVLGDELYMCIPRTEQSIIKKTEILCDHNMVKFFYLPTQDDGIKLHPVMLDDLELFTTYVSPLEDSLNQVVKRIFDIVVAFLCLVPTAILFPIVALMIKLQSPGPVFFKQRRTGFDGREFWMYKFRSMHVNADADRLQASKDDPRKFPFGNFMRKTSIDELPQFWNVLRGDMSIVGPRPHMVAHTEQYSRLIDKYMIRHYVKPGVTGWAQVTGFRGETHELWQMEGRVEHDIWYIQHWSVWLDIMILFRTAKCLAAGDKRAY